MRLQWSEIRARAAAFSERHKAARYEKGETQTFYNEFFACFGVNRRQVATYEQRVRNLPAGRSGFIDLFWPGTLIVEQKSAGLDLKAANNQALDYHDGLPESQRPRYILTCDFQRFHLLDLESAREWRFALADLKNHVEAFAFILDVQPREQRKQSPANQAASRLMGQLHEALAATGYAGHDLEQLLVRLLFILFADSTRIFDNKGQFATLIERDTAPEGTDLGRWLGELFEVLNTPEHERQSTLDARLAAFPYINGALFAERIRMPAFDNAMRDILLEACEWDLGEVSPAIFGTLFESVIDKVTQRKKGAHYTPEDAILRLIGPLFLDALHADLRRAQALRTGRDAALVALHDRMAALTFLDPACGAGNFLVVAYRELRAVERELIKERYLRGGSQRDDTLDAARLSRLNVDRFHGIEIDEFPARIAEVALWMTDHIANLQPGEDFGVSFARIPLVSSPGIHHADALEIDWSAVLPAERCSYVLGNPPFVGAKNQSDDQRAQVRRIAGLGGSGGTLDYVAAWFIKAGRYVQDHAAQIAFVSTNSITQGEQVAQLWPTLFHKLRLEISFAHRTFAWPGKAAVHCVIVGLARSGAEPAEKRLFSYINGKGTPLESSHAALTAYLFDAKNADRHLCVDEASRPINGAPRLTIGSKPVDGGYLIYNAAEHADLIRRFPSAQTLLRPFIGAEEYLHDGKRWILALQDAPPAAIKAIAPIIERLSKVRAFRKGEIPARRKDPTEAPKAVGVTSLALAETPTAFHVTRLPAKPFLLFPRHTSERRDYAPIGWVQPPAIPSDATILLDTASLFQFGVLTSRMHMAWLRQIGGRLKSDYRYSVGLVYNTFPWPNATASQRKAIEARAQAVLDARIMPKNATSSLDV